MENIFKLKGFYNYDNCTAKKIEIKGEIKVSENDFFKGIISYTNLKIPNQMISGQIYKEDDGSTTLSFVKSTPKNLANIIYELKKESGNCVQGKYSGTWRILPFKAILDYKENKVNVGIDTNISEVKDRVEIILSKKSLIKKVYQNHNNPY